MIENERAANFGDIYLNLETNYDIDCQLISFDVTKYNEKRNRYQDCVLYDNFDQKKVKIWEGRNGMPLEEKNRNQWLTFSLSARQGTGKWKDKKFLGGFWDSSAAVIDTPQNPQQGVQPPAQATKAPQGNQQDKKEPDWDAKDLRMARMNALTNSTKLICLIAEAHKEIDLVGKDRVGLVNLVQETAEIIVHYIYNGLTKKQAPDIQTQRCNQCGAEDVTQCSCTPW